MKYTISIKIVLICSRVWNEAAAHRLTTLGHRARQGDLVWKQRGEEGIEAGETSLPQVVQLQDDLITESNKQSKSLV